MAVTRMSVLGLFAPDDGVSLSKLSSELTLTNPKEQFCYVMPFPVTGDIGGEFFFTIPENYNMSAALVIQGVLDGTPANTLAFGLQQLAVADSESVDVAYEAEDLASNAVWTGFANEDMYTEIITMTPASAYEPGDTVFVKFFRDDSVDDTTFNFLLTDLLFQYDD